MAAVIGTSGAIAPAGSPTVHANELEKKRQDIQNQKSNIDSNIKSKEGQIDGLKSQEQKLNDEIKRLDMQVSDTNGKIREKEAEVEESKKQIEALKVQIEEVKERIAKRNELLKDRARSIQEGGGVISYLDVLLGAQDFSDFITRVGAVTTFVEADREIIKAHEEDMKLLEQSEAELSSELKKLETALTDLHNLKQTLQKQVAEKNAVMSQVKLDHEEALHDLYNLEDESSFLAEQDEILKQEIERQRLEEERKKREAEEAARRAAAEAKAKAAADAKAAAEARAAADAKAKAERAAQRNSSKPAAPAPKASAPKAPASSSGSGSGSKSAPAPAVTGGAFMWPAQGSFTSGYGARWGKLHAGIDIANASPNVPVVASASGTVIRANYSSSYGNVVYIAHSIGGKTYTTLYAHLDTMNVSSGQTVSKGQQIGYMGNTGRSTGKHLHFEIHEGSWSGQKNAVDPMKYLR
nr:peptidoglycan DD-metalloendopeptidase family protein [Metabacillus lacus]